jgi:hypothetical protein
MGDFMQSNNAGEIKIPLKFPFIKGGIKEGRNAE